MPDQVPTAERTKDAAYALERLSEVTEQLSKAATTVQTRTMPIRRVATTAESPKVESPEPRCDLAASILGYVEELESALYTLHEVLSTLEL